MLHLNMLHKGEMPTVRMKKMAGSDKLSTSYLNGTIIDSLLGLSPPHTRDITCSGNIYILRGFVIFSTLVKWYRMAKISSTSPNNLIPGNPLIFINIYPWLFTKTILLFTY